MLAALFYFWLFAVHAAGQFATHGLLNNQHPELSGLVFSLVDSRGRPRDGFLPAYDLRLNADYRELLAEHLPPAAALRAAQLAIRRKPQWSAPYYWAGFILQGEWR